MLWRSVIIEQLSANFKFFDLKINKYNNYIILLLHKLIISKPNIVLTLRRSSFWIFNTFFRYFARLRDKTIILSVAIDKFFRKLILFILLRFRKCTNYLINLKLSRNFHNHFCWYDVMFSMIQYILTSYRLLIVRCSVCIFVTFYNSFFIISKNFLYTTCTSIIYA